MKLLKFYTKTCHQCKAQTKLLEGFTDVEIVPIDCEEKEALAEKYQIRSLPTLILLNNDNSVKARFNGITAVDDIRKQL